MELLIWRGFAKCPGAGTVLQPNDELNGLSPQIFGELRVMEHGANSLEQTAVQRLRDSIVLGRVVCCKASLCPLRVEKGRELVAGVLPPTV
jgi:hypothetical protein